MFIQEFNNFDILQILNVENIEIYSIDGVEYGLLENGKKTDGWRVNKNKNIVTDFAKKGRAEGSPFNFIKSLHYYNDIETIKYIKQKYNFNPEVTYIKNNSLNKKLSRELKTVHKNNSIENNDINKYDGFDNTKIITQINQKKEKEKEINKDKEMQYLKNRKIKKNSIITIETNKITIPSFYIGIKDNIIKTKIAGLYSRNINSTEKNTRFIALKGSKGDSIYTNIKEINKESNTITLFNKEQIKEGDDLFTDNIQENNIQIENNKDNTIYIVEGMFDFLTIQQLGVPCIGLRAWNMGIQEIKKIKKHLKLKTVYIYDNDDNGKKSLELLKDIYKYNLYYIDINNIINKEIINNTKDKYKDINDISIDIEITKELLNKYTKKVIKENNNIDNAINQLKEYQYNIKENNGMLGIPGPFNLINKDIDGFIKGKVYTIGAFSNTGKSKFAYYLTNYFLKYLNEKDKENKNIHFYTLEVDPGMILMNLACNMEGMKWSELRNGKMVNKEYYENLYIYNIYKLEEIKKKIIEEKPAIAFIDFIQNIQTGKGSEYEKMANIAIELQQTAIESGTMLFNLSQLSNSMGRQVSEQNFNFVSFKGAGEIFASSDVIFLLYRKEDNIGLKIVKNKYGKVGGEFEFEVDFQAGNFTEIKVPDFD